MAEPPAKRQRTMAVSVGGGCGGQAAVAARSRKLRQTLLVVLFLVRASARATVTASINQIGGMLQRYVDRAFHKYHGMISSKLDSFQGQIEGLRHEVTQLSRLCSNRHADQQIRLEANQEHVAANESNTNIRLCFMNSLRQRIYTDKDITDENNEPIKVAVFEGDKMITTGPLSEAKIEILVLRGDFYEKCRDNWTEEEFDKHIMQDQNEKTHVLGTAWLTNGGVQLRRISFKEGSNRKKFVMGARIIKSKKISGRVQEAIMKPVTVMVGRNEPNEKSLLPRLDDDVYRLEKIARDGVNNKRLQEANICTVQDFLKALNKDSKELCKILQMKKKHKSWSKLTGHARKCILEDRNELKAYQTEDVNVMLFFNCVHDLVGATFHGNYIACEKFDTAQKASVNKLKEHAYNGLDGIPSDYVMKGNAPEQISSGTDVAPGPSVLPVDAGQLNSFGTGAAKNWPRDDINLFTDPIYLNANYGPMNTAPDDRDLNTHGCQDQGVPHGHQKIVMLSIGPDWQRNAQVPTDSPDLFEGAIMDFDMFQHPLGASTSAQPNLEPHDLPQLHQTAPASAPAWTTAVVAQPSSPEQDQGLSCSAFSGSGYGNDW